MLTVLLATRNRSKILQSVLSSFARMRKPPSGWKLLVVDNGSSDDTVDVASSFAGRLPLQLVKEARQGKSAALNAGLEFIEGELTILTDDDVFPCEDWLLQMYDAAQAHPDFSIFGGPIIPYWEVDPPPWIGWAHQGAAFALTDPNWKEGPIAAHSIWGPNTAIRSSIFESGIRFDTSIGPRGAKYVQGSDTELTRRLEHLGHRAWHVRGAVVKHFIRKEQLEKRWVMQRAIRYGRGEFRLTQAEELTTRRLLLGAPRHLFRELFREVWLITKAWIAGSPEQHFRARWRANCLRGQILESRAISKARAF